MKKIAFLFMFLCMWTPVSIEGAILNKGYEVTLTKYRNEYGNLAYEIEKTGSNPFVIEVDKGENSVFISDVMEANEELIFFGSIGYGTTFEKPKDAMVFRCQLDGVIIEEEIFDLGHDEVVLDLVDTGSTFLVKTWSRDEYSRDQIQYFTEYRLFDYELNELDTVTISEYFPYSVYEDGYYFYGYHYNNIVGCIDQELNVIENYNKIDIRDNTVFDGEVSIPILNDATLNGDIVRNGLVVDYPGKYVLVYNSKMYNFTVDPKITGVVDGKVYRDPVKPLVSAGNVLLNGELFAPGSIIEKPGNYQLMIKGVNGYMKSISFTITSNVTGVVNNQKYADGVQIEFDGDGYLNNEPVISPLQVDENGEYVFKVMGENNYLETYYFEVEDYQEGFDFIDFMKTYDIVFFGVVVVVSIFVLKRKK